MIRELTEIDRENTLNFLRTNIPMNIFSIGDIFHYGFERDFQQVWGDFDSHGELRAVLLRFYGHYLPYAPREFNIDGFVEVMEKAGNVKELSGSDEVVSYFETFPSLPLDWSSKRTFHFAELDQLELFLGTQGFPYLIRSMTIEDIESVMELREHIFGPESIDPTFFRQMLTDGSGQGVVAEYDGRIVGTALLVAETPDAGMLIGVGTDSDYRAQGIASHLVSQLCLNAVKAGKKVCLFYNNPDAGKIYTRIGFRDIGFWASVKVKSKEDTR